MHEGYSLMYNKLRDVLTIDPKNEEALETSGYVGMVQAL
jgi:hypothetical protein